MLRPRVAVVVASVFLAGCLPDYFPRRHLHVPATSADSWIDFSPDGHCELHKFVSDEDVFLGKATWKLEEEREGSRLTSVLHITFQTSERPVIFSLYFTRHHRKFVLWQYHSDPDGREYIEYESI